MVSATHKSRLMGCRRSRVKTSWGRNLQAMITLYKHGGQIDLIVADLPYSTGRMFVTMNNGTKTQMTRN